MEVVTSHSPGKNTAVVAAKAEGDLALRALGRHAHRRRQGIATLSVLSVEAGGEAAWHRWVEDAANGMRAVNVPWPKTPEDFCALAGRSAPLWMPPPPPSADGGGDEENDGDDALAVAVDLLAARLERGVPPGAWVCGLLVPAAEAWAYLARAPESRAKAYFREGLIALLPPRGVAGPGAPADGFGGPGPARAAASRVLWGATRTADPGGGVADPEEALARVDAAADALDAAQALVPVQPSLSTGPAGQADDEARSAAERFLFAMLEALPGTAGRFALNAPLPGEVRFGTRPAEVDLLAVGPRVAVEVDGYHHFTDAERYRRDRRKDVLFQEQGFLVLRFLADDVVPRLETILDTVRAAVARRLTRP